MVIVKYLKTFKEEADYKFTEIEELCAKPLSELKYSLENQVSILESKLNSLHDEVQYTDHDIIKQIEELRKYVDTLHTNWNV